MYFPSSRVLDLPSVGIRVRGSVWFVSMFNHVCGEPGFEKPSYMYSFDVTPRFAQVQVGCSTCQTLFRQLSSVDSSRHSEIESRIRKRALKATKNAPRRHSSVAFLNVLLCCHVTR